MLIKNIFIRSNNYHRFLCLESNISGYCIPLLNIRNCSTSLIEDKRQPYWNQRNAFKNNTSQNFNVQNILLVRHILRYKSTETSTSSLPKENAVAKEASEKKEIPLTVDEKNTVPLTAGEKLKKAMKEYGSTVIVFHTGISLISLGTCYLAVTSGLDISKVFTAVGLEEWATKSQIASSAGTFAVAYAIHKVFVPVRITITLASVPLIVRYLRKIGFLKK